MIKLEQTKFSTLFRIAGEIPTDTEACVRHVDAFRTRVGAVFVLYPCKRCTSRTLTCKCVEWTRARQYGENEIKGGKREGFPMEWGFAEKVRITATWILPFSNRFYVNIKSTDVEGRMLTPGGASRMIKAINRGVKRKTWTVVFAMHRSEIHFWTVLSMSILSVIHSRTLGNISTFFIAMGNMRPEGPKYNVKYNSVN